MRKQQNFLTDERKFRKRINQYMQFQKIDSEAPKMKRKANFFNVEEEAPKSKHFNQSNKLFNQSNNLTSLHLQICKGKRASKQIDVDQAMGIHFQDDVIVDILSRLPVLSLLRFKRVSKFWMTLISDPYFKKIHLNHAKNNQNSQKFLVSQFRINKDKNFNFYCSSLSSLHFAVTWLPKKFPFAQLYADIQRLDCPSSSIIMRKKIYCCADGLCLIGVSNIPGKQHLTIMLWNPTTRESIVLPHPELPTKGHCTWGMGYDSTSDDYKILKIDHEVCSEILALKSGSWRKIDRHPTGIDPVLSGMDSLAFLHGAFHWIGKSLNYSIVSFSISNEVYREIPLPEKMLLTLNVKNTLCGVSALKGFLYCYSTTYSYGERGTFQSWIMKDYGVKESWNICAGISSNRGRFYAIPKYSSPDDHLLVCCNYMDGSEFMCTRGQFGVWPTWNTFQDGFVYTESLISPKVLT